MASMSLSTGLISGLDTKTMISQLMKVEAASQDRLKTRLSTTSSQLTAMQSINSKTASMTSSAEALTKATLYTTAKAVSSSTAATAAVTGTPASGALSFTVDKLATASSIATTGLPTADFTLTKGTTSTPISIGSGSAADIVKAVNDAAAGVTAAAITDENGVQHLVLTSTTTGASSALSLKDTASGTAIGAATLSEGIDARATVGGSFSVTSATNTFTNLVDGVSVTVSATSADPVTITTSRNDATVTGAVSSAVASMNSVLGDISFHTRLAAGKVASSTSGGLLAGDSTMRDLSSSVLDLVSGSVGTDAAALAGLSVTREGTVAFDIAKLTALLVSDPKKAESVLTAFGEAVKEVGDRASNPTTGSLTLMVAGTQSSTKQLTQQIADWDVRLALREAALNTKWARMETMLGQLQSQSDALASSLSSMFDPNARQ